MNYESRILAPTSIEKYDFDFFQDLASMDCFSIVNTMEDLRCFENPRLKKWMQQDNFVIFGTGGSSLGGRCICSIAKNSKKNIKFVGNLDPNELETLFSELNRESTGFLCISKSGETLETICHSVLAVDFMRSRSSSDEEICDKFVFITEDKKSSLREFASRFGFLCLDHPRSIGGRFSVFSIVGMLPALLSGLSPEAIRSGAAVTAKNFGKILEGASFVFHNFRQKITQHVSFIYSDKLALFGAWLAQLYAESTGKSGLGITPITAIGAVDQHSQLQLYLDGANDKCFTFFVENQDSMMAIPKSAYLPSDFSYIGRKKITDIFRAQADATISSIVSKNHSLRKFEFQQMSPETLGSLLMHFMLEVACVCRLMGVNPFDQPAVEQGKKETKRLLDMQRC